MKGTIYFAELSVLFSRGKEKVLKKIETTISGHNEQDAKKRVTENPEGELWSFRRENSANKKLKVVKVVDVVIKKELSKTVHDLE